MADLPRKNNSIRRISLTSAEDVRKLMTSLINKITSGQISRENARAIGYLANIALDCLRFERDSELEKRLQKLEALLGENLDEGMNE